MKPVLRTQLMEALQQPELSNILNVADITKNMKFEVTSSSAVTSVGNSFKTTNGNSTVTSGSPGEPKYAKVVVVSSAGPGKQTLSISGNTFAKQLQLGQQQPQFILRTTPTGLRAVSQSAQQIQIGQQSVQLNVGDVQRNTVTVSSPSGVVNSGSAVATSSGYAILNNCNGFVVKMEASTFVYS